MLFAPVILPVSGLSGCCPVPCHAILMTLVIFAHIPPNTMLSPLQFGHLSGVSLHNVACFDTHQTMFHQCSSDLCSPAQLPDVGCCLHLHSILPHPQQPSQRVLGPAFVQGLNLYHTPAAVTPSLTSLSATLFPFTTKTTDDAIISALCSLYLMVRGFDSHLT